VKKLNEIFPFKQMQDFLKWFAQNAGVKHPIVSTAIVMVLAAVAWNIFVVYANGSKAEGSQTSVTQEAGDAKCSNIVATGGSVSVACAPENGKADDHGKKDSIPPNKDH
jgi:hypothetical protein